MITKETMEDVKIETERFLKAYAALKFRLDSGDVKWIDLHNKGCKESAALKRASLDLSTVLTKLRYNSR
jgi:hypothetical protein